MALVDDVAIMVKGGNGGDGELKYNGFRKGVKVNPSGGDGGRGGSIYIVSSHNLSDLSLFRFKKIIKADNGSKGMPKNHSGKDSADIDLIVPVGTKVLDENGLIADMDTTDKRILIARGGKGGMGSVSDKTEEVKGVRSRGEQGEEKRLRLVLSLIADVGLVGLPNAGKSSLLATLTAAHPKIGNYPFTTLEPNIGMMDKIILADIPGLIEGASKGLGLGTKFLKHIEKTRILLHFIEVTNEDPVTAYETVRGEFEKFNPELLEKKEIIVLN
jgi:GTP-binding protein